MHDLVILTTAIDRPELHSKVFPATLDYLKGLKCKWFITINNINNKVEETKENFRSILSDYDVTFTTYETGGTKMDFMRSCEQLSKYGHEMQPSIGYFWFEDDWMVSPEHKLKTDINQLFKQESCHISLANRTELSFNPGIWSKDLFEKLIYTNLSNAYTLPYYGSQKVLNPERVCTYLVNKTRKIVKHYHKISRYHDVGRSWQTNNLKGARTWNLV
jgi:hypothetical protein